MWTKLKRFCRYWGLRVLRIKATPHNIALGMAAGVFVGLLPVLPFQTVIAVAVAFLVGGSKIAAALGTWISNPLNWVPLYYLFYRIGKALVPFDVPPLDFSRVEMAQLIESGWKLFASMMLGGTVVATPSAIIAYFLTRKMVAVYQARKKARWSSSE